MDLPFNKLRVSKRFFKSLDVINNMQVNLIYIVVFKKKFQVKINTKTKNKQMKNTQGQFHKWN